MVIFKIATAVEAPTNMLILSGVWPQDNPPVWYRIRKFMTYWCSILLLLIMFSEVAISIQDIYNLSDSLLLTFEYFAYVVKLIVFHLEREQVRNLAGRIEDPLLNSYGEEHNVFVKSTITRTTFLVNAFKMSCFMCVSFLALRPFVGDTVFPVPFSFCQEGFMWYVIYIIQMSGLAIAIWTNSAMDTLFISYMGVALAELDILIYNIKHFSDTSASGEEKSDLAANEYLCTCSKHHNKIIELIKNIEVVCTKGVLAQFACSIVVNCSTAFQLIMMPLLSGQSLVLIVYFVVVMIQLAMYCWMGNDIILKSLEISGACYMSEWYKYSPKTNTILFLIMERAKRPLTISAYKFSILSLATYLKIIQCSYSYFTVLRRVYMKD